MHMALLNQTQGCKCPYGARVGNDCLCAKPCVAGCVRTLLAELLPTCRCAFPMALCAPQVSMKILGAALFNWVMTAFYY